MFRATGRLPKLHFPIFTGENPKLWQSRSENYFDMYGVDKSIWIRVAAMQFDNAAARWLQSIERKLMSLSWEDFCRLIHDRFGRDPHELLIRQLFHIKQLGSVSEYIEQFFALVDQLAAYSSSNDPLYFTLRFIDGLHDDIKSVVLVQRPQDLDTTCVLASLQEEVGDSYRRKDFNCSDGASSFKSHACVPLPLPALPSHERPAPTVHADDRRPGDTARLCSPDSKLADLRAYRHAMGLCYNCAEKWSKDHRCSPTVQLHAVQELWELFQLEDADVDSQSLHEGSSEQLFLSISKAAMTGQGAPHTMKFLGSIQHESVTMLVDSGSSHSFVSVRLA